MPAKQRLDILLVERGLVTSREKARAMIMAGEIQVAGRLVDKPGTQVSTAAPIELLTKPRFVSRGGEKLLAALTDFPITVNDRICADVGASTGGFTDCLLQHGAARVYAIDVGYGQLDYRLRADARVVPIERTNARYLDTLPEPVSIVTLDASFISLKLLLPVIRDWLLPQADIIPLIKPQFEAGREDVGKGGVVKDSVIHRRVVEDVLTFATTLGFSINGLITSPLKGPAGNTEFLTWLSHGYASQPVDDVVALIAAVIP